MFVEEVVSQGIVLIDSFSRFLEDVVVVKGELIESVRDFVFGRSIFCSEVIRKGIVDIQRGFYYDLKIGVFMLLIDVKKSDLVRSRGENFGIFEKIIKDQK